MRVMRHMYIGGALFAALAVLMGPGVARAQFDPTVSTPMPGGDGGGEAVPSNPGSIIHLPTGKPGEAGFYTSFEYVMLDQTRALGKETIATRGFYDSSGNITGVPGTFIGGGTVGLSTKNISGQDYQPGFNVEIGYRTDGGIRLFASYEQLITATYSRGAGPVPPGLSPDANLADTFLSSPAYNFNNLFSGPQNKLAVDSTGSNPGYTAYGIWNGATDEEMKFLQRYQQMLFGGRMPMFQTDFSRMYGIAAGQFSWIFERFRWDTFDTDVNGNQQPQWAAYYTNTLSQRMYGAMVGLGHEIFVANQFSLSIDATASGLMDVAVERAKYELGDQTTESKWGLDQYRFVPEVTLQLNFWWYPTDGIQIRLGYQAMGFFNTLYMKDPVGFDVGDINPKYEAKFFRLIHGFNAGIGFFF
jgi:hypothetical protein